MDIDFSILGLNAPQAPQGDFSANKDKSIKDALKALENAPQTATEEEQGRQPSAKTKEAIKEACVFLRGIHHREPTISEIAKYTDKTEKTIEKYLKAYPELLPRDGEDVTDRGRMKLEGMQSMADRYQAAYKEYQENIKRAGMLREEIAQGVKAGTDKTTLLLLAIECIAAMTGNPTYYNYLLELLKTNA